MSLIEAEHTEMNKFNEGKCPVCYENLLLNDDATQQIPQPSICRLECCHLFHTACLKTWFARNETCPLCKHVYTNFFNQMNVDEVKIDYQRSAFFQDIINRLEDHLNEYREEVHYQQQIINGLESSNRSIQWEIEQLKNANNNLKTYAAHMKQINEYLENEKLRQDRELNQLQKKCKTHSAAEAAMNRRESILEQRLANSTKKCNDALAEAALLRRACKILNSDIELDRYEIKSLEQEIEDITIENHTLEYANFKQSRILMNRDDYIDFLEQSLRLEKAKNHNRRRRQCRRRRK